MRARYLFFLNCSLVATLGRPDFTTHFPHGQGPVHSCFLSSELSQRLHNLSSPQRETRPPAPPLPQQEANALCLCRLPSSGRFAAVGCATRPPASGFAHMRVFGPSMLERVSTPLLFLPSFLRCVRGAALRPPCPALGVACSVALESCGREHSWALRGRQFDSSWAATRGRGRVVTPR